MALHEHYKASHDVEFLERLYNPYIRRVANFLSKYRDKKTGLPLPSHDLWEEQFGTFTYTSSSVYAGLVAAADFAGTLGKEVARRRWQTAAEEVKEGIISKMIHPDGRVMKSLRYTHFSPEADYTADASSFYGLFHFGVLDVNDPMLYRAYEYIKDHLTVRAGVGGIARYEGDKYFCTSGDISNPWIITTLWLAEYEIVKSKTKKELTEAGRHLQWALDRTNHAGMLSEQLDANTGTPVSVMPLVWSHAQYAITFLAYVRKLEEFAMCAPLK